MNLKNKTIDQLKKELTVGTWIECYYGNGKLHSVEQVTKVSEKSIWIGDFRESWNTVKESFDNGIYK